MKSYYTLNFFFSLFLALIFSQCQTAIPTETTAKNGLTGTYSDGLYEFVTIKKEYDKLMFEPSFKRGIFVLDSLNKDSLKLTNVMNNEENKLTILWNKEREIKGFKWDGLTLLKTAKDKNTPVQLLVDRQLEKAKAAYLKSANVEANQLKQLAQYISGYLPSKNDMAALLWEIVTTKEPKGGEGFFYLGQTLMVIQKRDLAQKAFEKAQQLGFQHPDVEEYQKVIENRHHLKQNNSFDMNVLFAAPKDAEIELIKKDWGTRDLEPKNIQLIKEEQVEQRNFKGNLQIFSYENRGVTNIGALFIPNSTNEKPLPVIVEAKGINWRYGWNNLSYRPKTAGFLDEQANEFIYIIPCFKGEGFLFQKEEFPAGGVPYDGWDGATDDLLTFFNVAVQQVGDKMDMERIVAFGDSRGGTVATLAAIRDKRFDAVVNWAGPVDWFQSMDGYSGWTLKEHLIDAINENLAPNTGTPGQFRDWYFRDFENFDENEWQAIRKKMIASSPLYFSEQLPQNVILHYGKEDFQVPIANGYVISEKLRTLGYQSPNFQYFFHENIGHDLNPFTAIEETKNFMIDKILDLD